MSFSRFPPVEKADEDGLLALGGSLSSEVLLEAYSSGIFPWPFEERYLAWFSPPKRAVLFLKDLRVPKSLLRLIKKGEYQIRINTCFKEVIEACARSPNRKGQHGTWITDSMIDAYCHLHKLGYAHSIEYFEHSKLKGGLYGVSIGRMFAGESMFYDKPNASKLALYHLVNLLKQQNVEWIDCQVMTRHLQALGAVEIERKSFIKMLRACSNSGKISWK